MAPLRLTLLSTAEPGSQGSMRRYGEWVAESLSRLPDSGRPTVALVSVAPNLGRIPVLLQRFGNGFHHLGCALSVRGRVMATQPHVVHLLDGSHGYLLRLLPRSVPTVATVHDVIPLLTAAGQLSGPPPSLFGAWLWRQTMSGLVASSGLVSVSARTRDDLGRLGGLDSCSCRVVHNPLDVRTAAADRARGPGESPCSSALQGDGCPRSERTANSPHALFLHVGHNGTYKNRDGVLYTVARVKQSMPVQVTMVGPSPTAELEHLVADLGLQGVVEWRCDVGDEELRALYQEADLLLFPSRYEGFGWPPLEAMAAGTPVVCSDAASLPEVVGDAALMAGPEDHDALAAHCVSILMDQTLQRRLVEAGYRNISRFTMERFAKELMDVYRALV